MVYYEQWTITGLRLFFIRFTGIALYRIFWDNVGCTHRKSAVSLNLTGCRTGATCNSLMIHTYKNQTNEKDRKAKPKADTGKT
jgi:hypothetical protein